MSGTQIIIYVHICQFSYWQILFTKIMNAIKESGLYDQCKEIRLGVVNHIDKVVDEPILNDPKISCIIHGHCSLYERNTLLHIRKKSEEEYAQYLYVHTKGLKYLDGSREQFESDCVKDWVDLMIHWNIYNWRKAIEMLISNDVYGCEFFRDPQPHFSGNFWWANSRYIQTLPKEIGSEYYDPEFWICKRDNPIICNIFSTGLPSGGSLYSNRIIKGVHY